MHSVSGDSNSTRGIYSTCCSVPSYASSQLVCAAHDYQSHTTRWGPVRYIWLHMPTCIVAPKADDGILRGADDAHFQQGDDKRMKWVDSRTY